MIERRRGTSRAQVIFVLLIIAMVVFLVWQFIAFQNALGKMPSGWTVAGAPATGLKPQQVIVNLRAVFSQTVTLQYRAETLTLSPQEVDFKLDEAATLLAMNDAKTEVVLNSPEGLKGLTFWADLTLKHKVVPPGAANTKFADVMTAYAQEKVAMYEGGPNNPMINVPTQPARKEAIAAMASAGPARPFSAIW